MKQFDLEGYLLHADLDVDTARLRFGYHVIDLTSDDPSVVELAFTKPAFDAAALNPLRDADVFGIKLFDDHAIIEVGYGDDVILGGEALTGELTRHDRREFLHYARLLADDSEHERLRANQLAKRICDAERLILKQLESFDRQVAASVGDTSAREREAKRLLPILRKLRGE